MCEVHTSMGKQVQMFCCGDWDPKRVPQGTECLEPLLDAASSHRPTEPQRSFTGQSRGCSHSFTFFCCPQTHREHKQQHRQRRCRWRQLECFPQLYILTKCSASARIKMNTKFNTFLSNIELINNKVNNNENINSFSHRNK